MTQLTWLAGTPWKGTAIFVDCERRWHPKTQLGNVAIYIENLNGRAYVFRHWITQTTIKTVSPDKNKTVFCDAARMRVTTLDLDHFFVFQARVCNKRRECLADCISMPQLAHFTITPTVNFAVLSESHLVWGTASDLGYPDLFVFSITLILCVRCEVNFFAKKLLTLFYFSLFYFKSPNVDASFFGQAKSGQAVALYLYKSQIIVKQSFRLYKSFFWRLSQAAASAFVVDAPGKYNTSVASAPKHLVSNFLKVYFFWVLGMVGQVLH